MPVAGAGALTLMLPVAWAQVVGELAEAVGAAGAEGAAFTVTTVDPEVHPDPFLTVTL